LLISLDFIEAESVSRPWQDEQSEMSSCFSLSTNHDIFCLIFVAFCHMRRSSRDFLSARANLLTAQFIDEPLIYSAQREAMNAPIIPKNGEYCDSGPKNASCNIKLT
jgi:hypothetical protein